MLTFATRLPGFLYDAANTGVSERVIEEVLRLAPGDTLSLKKNNPSIEQRGNYFSTPSHAEGDTVGRIVSPKCYFEDLVGQLRGLGLRIIFGDQRDGVAVMLMAMTKKRNTSAARTDRAARWPAACTLQVRVPTKVLG
jgi:hypothetical protein